MKEQLKILIIRLSAIGDTIHTLPLAYALRQKFPDAQIDWVVEDKASHFIENNPLLDNVFVIPKREWKTPFDMFDGINKIITKIKKENYDIAIDTQQLFKSGFLLGNSGAQRKITLSGGREFSSFFANEIIPASHKLFDKNYHVVKRNLEIAKYLTANDEDIKFVLPETKKETKKKVSDLLFPLKKNLPVLVIAPATTWDTKHWENKYWAKIIEEFQNKANIIITGTINDKDLTDDILLFGKYKNVLNLTGKTNLDELVEIFNKADIVIAPDSGSAQVAWATGKPFVISIFTSTSKNRTAPFGDNTKSFSPNIKCYPCHKKKCFNKNFEQCKTKIDYYEIINLLKELFK